MYIHIDNIYISIHVCGHLHLWQGSNCLGFTHPNNSMIPSTDISKSLEKPLFHLATPWQVNSACWLPNQNPGQNLCPFGGPKGRCCWVRWTISVFDSTLASVFEAQLGWSWTLFQFVSLWPCVNKTKNKVFIIIVFGACSSYYYSTPIHGEIVRLFNIPP